MTDHSTMLTTWVEWALKIQSLDPYVIFSNNYQKFPITTKETFVYGFNPNISEYNSYMKSFMERWTLRISAFTKANIELILKSLIYMCQQFNMRTVSQVDATDYIYPTGLVHTEIKGIVSTFMDHNIHCIIVNFDTEWWT